MTCESYIKNFQVKGGGYPLAYTRQHASVVAAIVAPADAPNRNATTSFSTSRTCTAPAQHLYSSMTAPITDAAA